MRLESKIRDGRPRRETGLARLATAFAVTSMGALALGAVAVGALAINALVVRSARFKRLEIQELLIGGQPFRMESASRPS